jgi:hypothetical protein
MVSADPLDGDDRAAADQRCGERNGVDGGFALRRGGAQRDQFRLRTASGAGNGLGVEPPILRGAIFSAAVREGRRLTQLLIRPRPLIRQSAQAGGLCIPYLCR